MNSKLHAACALLLMPGLLQADFPVRVQTDLGSFDMLLLDSVAPQTVANFMNYVSRTDYDGTFLHRSVPGFVVQGGGYVFTEGQGGFVAGGTVHIDEDPPVVNEFGLSNVRGTVAMAKLGNEPDSATSEFFFNLADNSANLDNQNGGFTVFAQVQGNGMDVIDAIAALPVCAQLFGPQSCNQQPYTADLPLADLVSFQDNTAVVNIRIGIDSDGDGVMDSQEVLAANNGNGSDTVQDSQQQHIASFQDEFGNSLTLESPMATPIEDFSMVGTTFRRANPPEVGSALETAIMAGGEFCHAGAEFSHTVGMGGALTVTLTLPAGAMPVAYYNFGPTAAMATPHWYEFDFDAASGTGAQISGNVITLHYVDGLRGDSDLDGMNGVIVSPPGSPLGTDDQDGVFCYVENNGPNAGDGNGDGELDGEQAEVVTLRDFRQNFLTLEAIPDTVRFENAAIVDPNGILATVNPADHLNGLNFAYGFIDFELHNVGAMGSAQVKVFFPAGEEPVTWFKYGPRIGSTGDELYEFFFDMATGTGAQFSGNIVTLNFVDGGRGDADLDNTNGIIDDPGAPALLAPLTTPGSGGGCMLVRGPAHAGGLLTWLLLFAVLYAARRLTTRQASSGR